MRICKASFGHLVFRAGSSGLRRSILDVTYPAPSPCEAAPKPLADRLSDERALMVALGFAPSADKVLERIGQECDKLSGAQRAINDGGEDLQNLHFGLLVFRAGSSGLRRSILDVTNPAPSPL